MSIFLWFFQVTLYKYKSLLILNRKIVFSMPNKFGRYAVDVLYYTPERGDLFQFWSQCRYFRHSLYISPAFDTSTGTISSFVPFVAVALLKLLLFVFRAVEDSYELYQIILSLHVSVILCVGHIFKSLGKEFVNCCNVANK